MDRDQLRTALLDYAWLGSAEEREREVECILSGVDLDALDARAELYRAAEGRGDAIAYVVSEMYECHAGPHLPTCPLDR